MQFLSLRDATRSPIRCALLTVLIVLATDLGLPLLLEAEEISASESAFFEKHIRPLLVDHCYRCHSTQSKKVRGGLVLDSRDGWIRGGDSGQAIIAAKPEVSLLIEAVRYTKPDLQMPPAGKLSKTQIELLVKWVAMGAPDPRLSTNQTTAQKINLEHGRSFWSFQPPTEPDVPAVSDEDWPTSVLDRFILASLENADLRPASPANKRTLIRRATLDLLGIPPSPGEIEAFLADDRPDAFVILVDRLLASPQYGERWARHWLDVARYADSNGLDENLAYGNVWRYRDYVVESFNRDKPYDRFVLEQIAGDLLPPPQTFSGRNEQLIATGFLSLGPKVLAEPDPNKMEVDIIDEQVDTVGRTFMGLTLGCARCHDHKFDPIRTRDYYSFAGIFKSTKTMEHFRLVARWHENSLASKEELADRKAYDERHAKEKGHLDGLVAAANDELIENVKARIADYLIAASETERLGADEEQSKKLASSRELNLIFLKRWQAYLVKTRDETASALAPWHLHQSDLAGTVSSAAPPNAAIARAVGDTRRSTRELAERYEALFQQADTAWKQLVASKPTNDSTDERQLSDPGLDAFRQVLVDPQGPFAIPKDIEPKDLDASYDKVTRRAVKKKRDALAALEQTMPELPHAMGVTEGDATNLRVHIRGSFLNLGDEVNRGFPAVLTGDENHEIGEKESGRLQLGTWLVNPAHPLTARVMANRIWRWHFGTGIVSTPDNFGERGERPVNQPLLDWLALRFMEDGWSIKTLHRRIMLSSTYRMSSSFDADAAEFDPDNRLRWRADVRRLDAETLRDSLLQVSGTLDLTIGGSLLKAKNRGWIFDHTSKDETGYDTSRRSLYLPIVRNHLYEMFQLFDYPDPAVVNGDRSSTTVTPQALFLMNSDFIADATLRMAKSLQEREAPNSRARLHHLYQSVYGRAPTDGEVKTALRFLRHYRNESVQKDPNLDAWQAFCQVLVASNEFVYVQ